MTRQGFHRLRRLERARDRQHVERGAAGPSTAAPTRSGNRLGFDECRGHRSGTGFERNANRQGIVGADVVLVNLHPEHVVFGNRDQLPAVGFLELAADSEAFYESAVHPKLDLVFGHDSVDEAVLIACQPDLKRIFPVERERVLRDKAAERGKAHFFAHPRVLPRSDLHFVLNCRRTIVGRGERDSTDLGRRRDIARHQRRRNGEHVRVVVEPEPCHVAWEQLGAVHFHAEQIVDGVHVLGAIQPA